MSSSAISRSSAEGGPGSGGSGPEPAIERSVLDGTFDHCCASFLFDLLFLEREVQELLPVVAAAVEESQAPRSAPVARLELALRVLRSLHLPEVIGLLEHVTLTGPEEVRELRQLLWPILDLDPGEPHAPDS